MLRIFNIYIVCFCKRFGRTWGEEGQDCVHPVPDPGAGEGVPLQPVPDPQEEDRDIACPLPLRETDQNLVSEPQDEVEEGQQAEEHEHGGSRRGRLQALISTMKYKTKIVISTSPPTVSKKSAETVNGAVCGDEGTTPPEPTVCPTPVPIILPNIIYLFLNFHRGNADVS